MEKLNPVKPPPASLGPEGTKALADFLGNLFTRVTFTYGVSELLGVSVQAEQATTEFLAVYLGRDAQRIERLSKDAIPHLPYDKQLQMLEQIISENGWDSEFTDLVSTLRKLHQHRNNIAHSYGASDGRQGTGGVFLRTSYRKGRERNLRIKADEVFALIESVGHIISTDLLELARRSWPTHEANDTAD